MLKINWETYINDMNILISKIDNMNMNIKKIYAIPRGGLIPATIISHYFDDIPIITTLNNDEFDNYQTTLIVDDLCDTGTTMRKISRMDSRGNLFYCALYRKSHSTFYPDFLVRDNIPACNWIVFPYDREPKDESKEIEKHNKKIEGEIYLEYI